MTALPEWLPPPPEDLTVSGYEALPETSAAGSKWSTEPSS